MEIREQLRKQFEWYLGIGVQAKEQVFEKFIDRIATFTSDTAWSGTVQTCKQGMYFVLDGTRSKFQVYIDCHGNVTRKPRNIEFNNKYSIDGNGKSIWRVM